MSSDVSLHFSEEEAEPPKRGERFIDLLLEDDDDDEPVQKRAKNDPPAAREETVAAPQQQQEPAESSSEIDLNQFYVPLSKQRLYTDKYDLASERKAKAVERKAAAEANGTAKKSAPKKPRTKRESAGRGTAKKAGKGRGRGRGKATAEKDEEEEIDEVRVEEDYEPVPVRVEQRAPQTVVSMFAAAAPAAASVEKARDAREFFVLLRRDACAAENAGCSESELENILQAMWESADDAEKVPFLMLEEVDQRREAAERQLSALKKK